MEKNPAAVDNAYGNLEGDGITLRMSLAAIPRAFRPYTDAERWERVEGGGRRTGATTRKTLRTASLLMHPPRLPTLPQGRDLFARPEADLQRKRLVQWG